MGMPVALDNLRGDRRGLEAELFADVFLDARIKMRVRADGAGELAHRDLLARLDQSLFGPAKFVVHQRKLEAVGDRLGVDAVRAAHHRREFVLPGARGDGGAELPKSASNKCALATSCSASVVSSRSDEVSPR